MNFIKHIIPALGIVLICSTLFSCGLGGGDSGGGSDIGTTSTDTPPVFKGILLAYSPETEKINLHWPEASDDTTDTAQIKYHIYKGDSNDINVVLQSSNLVTTLVNETNYTMEGLSGGQPYYCLVTAEDKSGNTNEEHTVVEVTVLSANIEVAAMPKTLADMDLSVTVNSDNNLTLSGNDISTIQPDDVIIAAGVSGQTLKKSSPLKQRPMEWW